MIMSYILVNQHNNVINWSLNQLDMLLFIKIKCYNNRIAREARRKFLARGGQKCSWGGTQNFLDGGGTGLDGGGLPLHLAALPSHDYIISSRVMFVKRDSS